MKFSPGQNYNNDRWKCIVPEELHELQKQGTVQLSFSYNPHDQYDLAKYGGVSRFNLFKGKLRTIFSEAIPTDIAQYTGNIEISKKGRLHFHGVLNILDEVLFYLYSIPRLQSAGSYEIDTIEDIVKWKEYCEKQEDYWSEYNPLIQPRIDNLDSKIVFEADTQINRRRMKHKSNMTDIRDYINTSP